MGGGGGLLERLGLDLSAHGPGGVLVGVGAVKHQSLRDDPRGTRISVGDCRPADTHIELEGVFKLIQTFPGNLLMVVEKKWTIINSGGEGRK